MANRVLLNTSGLRISKPGVNVLTADDSDLLFNSDNAFAAVYATGTRSITTTNYTGSITIGRSFASPPMIAYRAGSFVGFGLGRALCATLNSTIGVAWDEDNQRINININNSGSDRVAPTTLPYTLIWTLFDWDET